MNCRIILNFIFLLALVVMTSAEASPPSVFWGNLQPGPYDVGFDIRYEQDLSRTYTASDGTLLPRPVRISIWYPANGKSARKMPYRGYVDLLATPKAFVEFNRTLTKRNRQSLQDVIIGTEELERIFNTPTGASWKAPHIRKRFPVVAYSAGLNETWQHANFTLSEYLASHGYVVITVPQLGSSAIRRNLRINPVDLELQLRDLEYAIGAVREAPNVDPDRSAVMGHSMGGVVALLLQMRNPTIDAVIGLDSPAGLKNSSAWLTKSIYYQSSAMRVPLLDLRRKNEDMDLSAIESFRYAPRYIGIFSRIAHADFTSFPLIASNFKTNIQGRTAQDAAEGQQVVSRYVLAFLNYALKQDDIERELMFQEPAFKGVVEKETLQFRKPLTAPPTEEDYVRMIIKDGYDATLQLYEKFKKREPDQDLINESIGTALGYDFLGEKEYETAIAILRLVFHAHPGSANAADSVAEAYLLSGNNDLAQEYYKRVLELVETDRKTAENTRESLKQNAREKLKQLNSE